VKQLPLGTVLIGDARVRLAELPASSIDCVITSPPYFLLRNYGVKNQIGLESTVEDWVDELTLVMRGLSRVLKATGSVWLNVGDSYSRHPRYGATRKSLLLGPERLALKLNDEGWIIRNRVIWAKANAMPESVRDRMACKSEVIYFLTRAESYYFDLDVVRVPHRSKPSRSHRAPVVIPTRPPSWAGPTAGANTGIAQLKKEGRVGHPLGANPGDVWRLPSSSYRGAHFATFPEALVIRPLLSSCPERVCQSCGQPWHRQAPRQRRGHWCRGDLVPGCECQADYRRGVVLDPFMGAGTVGVVAARHGRDWLGIELNPEFAELAKKRIADS
jgi:site-specific DNA-methyltransferase (adenine-specific)